MRFSSRFAFPLVLASSVLFWQGSRAGAGQSGEWRVDLTGAFEPAPDGLVSSVLIRDQDVLYATETNDYDGSIYISQIGRSASSRQLLSFGLASSLAQRGIIATEPKLLAWPDRGRILLNLICSSKFPAGGSDPTGNIIVYDLDGRQLTNLTALSHASGKFIRGLKWFSKEQLLLAEQSLLDESDQPRPKPGTATPVCIELRPYRQSPIERHPSVSAWYRQHSGIQVKFENPIGQAAASGPGLRYAWTISRGDGTRPIRFQGAGDDDRLRVYCVSENLICISNWELGTWLVDFRQTIRVLLTPDMAIDYDEDSRTLVLQSKKRDANHASRYWLLNLRRYASTLSHRVPVATAGGPDVLKELTSEP